jgi:predicted nucleotidyltransferase
VTADRQALEERLRGALQRHPRVLVAYLFGSTARGRAGPLSDVDVAVLLAEDGDPFPAYLDVVGELGSAVGPDRVDVVLLNDAPVALACRVLRDGRLLLCRDERARIDHWVRTVDRFLDMEPFRRIFEVARISELPGMLGLLGVPGLRTVALRASGGVARRGLRNLVRLAEERTAAGGA